MEQSFAYQVGSCMGPLVGSLFGAAYTRFILSRMFQISVEYWRLVFCFLPLYLLQYVINFVMSFAVGAELWKSWGSFINLILFFILLIFVLGLVKDSSGNRIGQPKGLFLAFCYFLFLGLLISCCIGGELFIYLSQSNRND